MSQQGKVDRQAGYVLHAQPYRETSLLLEIFTPNHGRLTLVARGARRRVPMCAAFCCRFSR